jgi:hypothetical protein
MQFYWVVVAAVLACGCKSEKPKTETERRMETLRNEPGLGDGQIAHMTCEVAKDFDKDPKARDFLLGRLETRVDLDHETGTQLGTHGDVVCILDALAASTHKYAKQTVIARAYYKYQTPAAKKLYDAMSEENRKLATIEAVVDLGKQEAHWKSSAKVALPLMLDELDKLGGGNDRTKEALASAGQLYPTLPQAVKDRIGAKPKAPLPLDQLEPQLATLANHKLDTDPNKSPMQKINDIGPIPHVGYEVATIGPPAVPQLVDIWQVELNPPKIRAAALALAHIDPARFTKEAIAALDAYDAAFRKDPGARFKAPAETAAAGLHAALDVRHKAVDVLLRALSSPDDQVTAIAADGIKKNLEAEPAISSLFRYMAAKDKYNMREINVYVDVITHYREAASPLVVKNLEALLAAAKSPAKVFWAHKVVAMTALQRVGKKDAAPTVEKFASDPGSYYSQPAGTDPNDLVAATKKEQLTFKSLAETTLAEVTKR